MQITDQYTASYKGKRIEFSAETLQKAQRHAEQALNVPPADYLEMELEIAGDGAIRLF